MNGHETWLIDFFYYEKKIILFYWILKYEQVTFENLLLEPQRDWKILYNLTHRWVKYTASCNSVSLIQQCGGVCNDGYPVVIWNKPREKDRDIIDCKSYFQEFSLKFKKKQFIINYIYLTTLKFDLKKRAL